MEIKSVLEKSEQVLKILSNDEEVNQDGTASIDAEQKLSALQKAQEMRSRRAQLREQLREEKSLLRKS